MNRLEQLRIDAGLTARALALEADVSHQTVINIEQGKPAHAPTLKKLGDYFEVPASSLTRPAIFAGPGEEEAA
jgi:DNA-binding XRE family transcriptional regulator